VIKILPSCSKSPRLKVNLIVLEGETIDFPHPAGMLFRQDFCNAWLNDAYVLLF